MLIYALLLITINPLANLWTSSAHLLDTFWTFTFIRNLLHLLRIIHVHSESFTFIHGCLNSLGIIYIHSQSFTFIQNHLHSFTDYVITPFHIHLHPFTFVYIHSPSCTFNHDHLHSVGIIYIHS